MNFISLTWKKHFLRWSNYVELNQVQLSFLNKMRLQWNYCESIWNFDWTECAENCASVLLSLFGVVLLFLLPRVCGAVFLPPSLVWCCGMMVPVWHRQGRLYPICFSWLCCCFPLSFSWVVLAFWQVGVASPSANGWCSSSHFPPPSPSLSLWLSEQFLILFQYIHSSRNHKFVRENHHHPEEGGGKAAPPQRRRTPQHHPTGWVELSTTEKEEEEKQHRPKAGGWVGHAPPRKEGGQYHPIRKRNRSTIRKGEEKSSTTADERSFTFDSLRMTFKNHKSNFVTKHLNAIDIHGIEKNYS